MSASATATAAAGKTLGVPSLASAMPPYQETLAEEAATASAAKAWGASLTMGSSATTATTTMTTLAVLVFSWNVCLRHVFYAVLWSLAVAALCNASSWLWVVWSDLNDRHRHKNGHVRNVTCFVLLTGILLHYHRAVHLLQQSSSNNNNANNGNSLHSQLSPFASTTTSTTRMNYSSLLHQAPQHGDDVASERVMMQTNADTENVLSSLLSNNSSKEMELQMLLLAAVSMTTGYLIFEALFVRIYCFPHSSWIKSMERMLAVLVFASLSILLLVKTIHTSSTTTTTIITDETLRFYIHAVWHAYSFVQLITAFQAIQVYQKERQEARQKKGQNTASNGSTFVSTTAQKKASAVIPTNHWIVHGVEYNLTDFVARHPGGSEAILLGQGRDCTALFESYHPFTNQHRVVLAKYRVSSTSESTNKSNSTYKKEHNDDDIPRSQQEKEEQLLLPKKDFFYSVLCERAAAALRQAGVDPIQDRGATTGRMLYYTFILTLVITLGYGHVVQGKLWCAFPFGVCAWLLGSLGHDAGHFAASRRPIVNDVGLLLGASFMGNPIMWQHQHTYAHHSFTNDVHSDPDLHHFHTFLRVHNAFRRKHIHKNQSSKLFVTWAWTFVIFGTCVLYPRDMILQHSLHCLVEWTDRHRWSRVIFMYTHLILFVSLFMILPFFTYGAWYKALLACTLHIATSSALFAFFSQVNHINEAALDDKAYQERNAKRPAELQNSWAIQQVETSNNYALDNQLWYYLALGLNHQIEHHLFPGLNHCHLHIVTPVVEATCREYGVVYKNYKTYSEAVQTVFDWLDLLAKTANTPEQGGKPLVVEQVKAQKQQD